jgi:hypothetical protein
MIPNLVSEIFRIAWASQFANSREDGSGFTLGSALQIQGQMSIVQCSPRVESFSTPNSKAGDSVPPWSARLNTFGVGTSDSTQIFSTISTRTRPGRCGPIQVNTVRQCWPYPLYKGIRVDRPTGSGAQGVKKGYPKFIGSSSLSLYNIPFSGHLGIHHIFRDT